MRLLQVHSALGAVRVAERGVRGDPAPHQWHPPPQRQGRLREPRRDQLADRGGQDSGDDDGGAAGRVLLHPALVLEAHGGQRAVHARQEQLPRRRVLCAVAGVMQTPVPSMMKIILNRTSFILFQQGHDKYFSNLGEDCYLLSINGITISTSYS